MVKLTKEDLKIVACITNSDEPMTAYQISKTLRTYPQKITYRLEKLREMGLILLNNGDKATYKSHPIFDCPEHLRQIAKLIADVAEIIDEHHPSEGEQLEAIIYFVLQRTSITKEANGSREKKLCEGIQLQ